MDIVELGMPPTAGPKPPAEQAATDRLAVSKPAAQPALTPQTNQAQGVSQPDRERAERIVKSLQDDVDAKGVKLSFKLLGDNGGGTLQVEVKDANSGKVIRKIPQDEIVKLEQTLKTQARGLKENYV